MRRAVLLSLALLLAHAPAHAREGVQPAKSPRFLLICVDGVGYDLVEEMYNRGELPHFAPPAAVINAFPSLTNPGLVEILAPLGAPASRGYEDWYFDPARNRLRGGIFHRMSRKHFIASTYRHLFDFHPHQLTMTYEYALPVVGPWLNGLMNVAEIKKKFKESRQAVFFAYFDSTDTATHLYGKWLVRQQLRALDRLAGELRAASEPRIEVVVFSDHGNELGRLRRARLETSLRHAGFRLQAKLKDERSVVMPLFGLVGSAVLYTQPGQEMAVAEALRDAEGVDLAVYRQDGVPYVVSRKGTARIERRVSGARVCYRYRPATGDPLLLAPIAEDLGRAGQADREGFIAEEQWLRATADHVYPDPLRRIWSAFDGLVAQPASVIVSLDDGYYTGSRWLDLFAWMQATHGNLRRAQSRGVVFSTNPVGFPPDGAPLTGENLLSTILRLRCTDPKPGSPCAPIGLGAP